MPSAAEPESFGILERLEHVRFRMHPIKMTAHRIRVPRPRKRPVACRRPRQVSYPTGPAVLTYQPGAELLNLNGHMRIPSQPLQEVEDGLTGFTGAHARLFLVLQLKFQRDRRIVRAERSRLS